MMMTPEEAAAIALALAALEASVERPAGDLVDRPSWSSIHDPRTWLECARREALGLDADVS